MPNRASLMPACLFLALTIPGCAAVPPLAAPLPEANDHVGRWSQTIACPKAAESDRAEARRGVASPLADTVSAAGRPAISKDATRDWVDRYEVALERKNHTIVRLADQNDRCGGLVRPSADPNEARS